MLKEYRPKHGFGQFDLEAGNGDLSDLEGHTYKCLKCGSINQVYLARWFNDSIQGTLTCFICAETEDSAKGLSLNNKRIVGLISRAHFVHSALNEQPHRIKKHMNF
jgi:hypothetical protein